MRDAAAAEQAPHLALHERAAGGQGDDIVADEAGADQPVDAAEFREARQPLG
jgi:hypothetical protein